MNAVDVQRKGIWALLSRVTSSGRIIPEIDGLRFIAIVAVLGFHINGEYIKVMGSHFPGQIQNSLYDSVLGTWDFGVPLFFVISGFILGLPFIRHHWNGTPRPRLGQYYLRRVTRIEPPYIINLIICSALLLIVKGPPLSELLPHLAASLFYVHNLVFHSMSSINFVLWSLEIEAQFYLAAPWLTLIFAVSRRGQYLLPVAALLASTGAAWWLNRASPLFHLTILGHLPYFLAGFLLAGWYSQNEAIMSKKSLGWDLAGAAAWTAIQLLLLHKGLASAIILPFLVACAYACVFKGRILGMILTRPAITAVGGMCYTVYLYHPFLKSALKHLLFRFQITSVYWVNSAVQILALGGLIVVVCSVFFLVFEKPFMYRGWPASLMVWIRKFSVRGLAAGVSK